MCWSDTVKGRLIFAGIFLPLEYEFDLPTFTSILVALETGALAKQVVSSANISLKRHEAL